MIKFGALEAGGTKMVMAVLDEEGRETEAGNGNGFKLGGSNMPGGHTLRNPSLMKTRRTASLPIPVPM